jgi:hypothetical protein
MLVFHEEMAGTFKAALYHEYLSVCRETNDFQRVRESRMSEGIKDIWEFIKEIAAQAKARIKDIVNLFKNKSIFQFFSFSNFNLETLKKNLKLAYQAYAKIAHAIPDLAVKMVELGLKTDDPKVLASREKRAAALRAVNIWIKEHKTVLRVSGIIFAGILILIWLQVGLTGDVQYDIDFAEFFQAVQGKLTFVDFITNHEQGLKWIILAVMGTVGLNFGPLALIGKIKPFLDSKPAWLAFAVIKALADKVRMKIGKGNDAASVNSAERDLKSLA